MLLRALAAFLALPGLVGFAAPAAIAAFDPMGGGFFAPGLALMALGAALLLWCVRDFYVAGKGTLAPWAPPRDLVTVGLYRFCRNPMYVAVLTLVLGWAATLTSPLTAIYAAALAIGFHLRVVINEEPFLERRHGAAWRAYKARTPRWPPRLRRY